MIKAVKSQAFVRYLTVGGCTFVAEYGSFYALFVILGIRLNIANGLSFCLALGVNFLLNRLWTFQHKKLNYHSRAAHQFIYYILLALANLVLTILLVDYLKYLGIDPRIGKLIAMVVTSLWNFFVLQKAIFKYALIKQS